MSFVHLHVHTHYSLLDGFSNIKKLMTRAKEYGMPAVTISDHGTMYGVIEFYNAAKAAGIKPIIGLESYLAPRGMTDKDSQYDKRAFHLLLLAENDTGYKNLLKIASAAQLDGFYYHPRIDKDYLAAHSEGLIATSSCLKGEVPNTIMERGVETAQPLLDWYFNVFGRDRFFLELQRHDMPELEQVNQELLKMGARYNARYVATNDVHYVDRSDARYQDILLAIQTGALLSDPHRMHMNGDSYYFRSPEEMSALFSDVPESITNTLEIADRCNVNLDPDGYHLPLFEVPEGFTAQTYLRKLCDEGLKERYHEHADDKEVLERLEYELGVIHKMGFDAYFLIVWDLSRYARDHNIWYEARGSAAGSIVAYSLGITSVEPLRHGLIFERFLNPDRVNMPDVDMDFQDDKRTEIMEYCADKYGHDHVAQIITFGTMGARNAIRDVGRVMDIPLNEVDQIAKMIPNVPSRPTSIPEAIEQVPSLKELYNSQPYLKDLIDAAAGMEGVARNVGTHAAGVIISDKPIVEYVPLHRPTSNSEDVPIKSVTQYEMTILDHLGMLKVDFLGLSTLTVMQKASDLIFKRHNVRYTLDNIPVDDAETYEFLGKGLTAGVFQLEGVGMTRFLVEMKPTKLDNIIAMVALYRPGPMDTIPSYIKRMHGEEEITYRHPLLEPIMGETYGFAIYQEQVMQAAMGLAGYTAAEADMLRKVISKKKEKELKKHHEKFVNGAVERGIDKKTADEIFVDWEGFAHYGFNKSHAADYGVVSVQTAFLKTHYAIEYMTALLSQVKNESEKVALYVADCRAMGIDVLPPDVNYSGWDFEIEDTGDGQSVIRFGLGAVKNVGQNPIDLITEARADGGKFKDINDFARRVDLRKVGRRALESMIRVGALDTFADRHALLSGLENVMAVSESHFKAREAGQMTIFGFVEGLDEEIHLPAVTSLDRREKLEWEHELLGIYLSDHPLSPYMTYIRKRVTHFSAQLKEAKHGSEVVVAGKIAGYRTIITKKGSEMAFATLEDLQGSIELVIFPRTWSQYAEVIRGEGALLVKGKADTEKIDPKVLVDYLEEIPPDQGNDPEDDPMDTLPVQSQSPRLDDYDLPPLDDDDDAFFGGLDIAEDGPVFSGDTTDRAANTRSFSAGRSTEVALQAPAAPLASITAAMAPVVSYVAESEVGQEVPGETSPRVSDASSGAEPESISPNGNHKVLLLQLASCGSRERDNRRLKQIYGFLTSTPGSDQFAFLCQENGQTVRLDFPNDNTCINDSMLREVRGIVGEANVIIEE